MYSKTELEIVSSHFKLLKKRRKKMNINIYLRFVPLTDPKFPEVLKLAGYSLEEFQETILPPLDFAEYTMAVHKDEFETEEDFNQFPTDLEKPTLFLYGTPNRAYPMSVKEYVHEIGLFTDAEIEDMFT
jgi:hypothetical protein